MPPQQHQMRKRLITAVKKLNVLQAALGRIEILSTETPPPLPVNPAA